MHVTTNNRTEENIGFEVFTKTTGSETMFNIGNYSLSIIIAEDMGSVEIVIDKKSEEKEVE